MYKYITENDIEWRRHDNEGSPDILIYPRIFQMDDFFEMVKGHTTEQGIPCILRAGYFVIWMEDLCSYYGIDSSKVFIGDGH